LREARDEEIGEAVEAVQLGHRTHTARGAWRRITRAAAPPLERACGGLARRDRFAYKPAMTRRWLMAILVVGALLRAWAIDLPIGGVHGWRQADTAAMARNFHEGGYRFLCPQIDWRGGGDGCVESEAPVYAVVVALLYGAFGVWEGWGRLLSLLASLGTAVLLFRIGRREADERVGLFAAGLYVLLPMNLYYGRAFMPEPTYLCLLAGAVDAFSAWSARQAGARALWLGGALVGLAAAMKLPNLYIGLPLLVLALRRGGARALRQPALWGAGIVAVAPALAWYLHAHDLGVRSGLSFGFWGPGGEWSEWSRIFSLDFWNRILFQWVAERHATWPGFALLLAGLWLARSEPRLRALTWSWLAALVVYSALIPRRTYVHEYYALPFMLPGALAMALPCARWLRRGTEGLLRWRAALAVVLLAGVLASSALTNVRYAGYVGDHWPLEGLGDLLRERTPPGALVVVADHGDAVPLYRAHRKGWNAWPERVTPAELRQRAAQGAGYFAAVKSDFPGDVGAARLRALAAEGTPLHDDARYLIVRLHPVRAP
jgi:4-amino-4-deoxy-L-arabinose transferase-like glycosyltransferase